MSSLRWWNIAIFVTHIAFFSNEAIENVGVSVNNYFIRNIFLIQVY